MLNSIHCLSLLLEATIGQLALLCNDSLNKPSPVRDLTNYTHTHTHIYIYMLLFLVLNIIYLMSKDGQ